MTLGETLELLAEVEFLDWEFEVSVEATIPFLRVAFLAPDNHSPGSEPVRQYGRKWRLSQRMTRSEIVTTAFKAVLTAMEHETREQFKYKGVDVFGPHIDVDAMHEAYSLDKRVDSR
jgi:hypothetical protein